MDIKPEPRKEEEKENSVIHIKGPESSLNLGGQALNKVRKEVA